jgi:CheY-like chemotaxis protein
MFLRTDRDCEVGARFNMTFALPGLPGTFETQAEVVWRRRPPQDAGLGVRFLDLSESQRKQIAAFVLDRWSQQARSVLLALPPHPLRNALRDLMGAEGLEPLCADDGKAALAHLESLGGLGAILLETSLPGTAQLQVLRDLRSRHSVLAGEVPIVLLLREGLSPLEVDRLRNQGASAVLGWGEPGDPAKVLAAVVQLMGRAGPKRSPLPAG